MYMSRFNHRRVMAKMLAAGACIVALGLIIKMSIVLIGIILAIAFALWLFK